MYIRKITGQPSQMFKPTWVTASDEDPLSFDVDEMFASPFKTYVQNKQHKQNQCYLYKHLLERNMGAL